MIECGMFKHMSFLVSSIYSRMTDLKRYRWSDLTKSLVKSRAASGKHGGLTHIMGNHGTSLEPIDLTPQYIHHGPHEWAINCW